MENLEGIPEMHDKLINRFDRIETKLAQHDSRFDCIDTKLDTVIAKVQEHDQILKQRIA